MEVVEWLKHCLNSELVCMSGFTNEFIFSNKQSSPFTDVSLVPVCPFSLLIPSTVNVQLQSFATCCACSCHILTNSLWCIANRDVFSLSNFQLYKEIELCSKIKKVIQFDRDESCMIGYGNNYSVWCLCGKKTILCMQVRFVIQIDPMRANSRHTLSDRFLDLYGGGRQRAAALHYGRKSRRISVCQRFITSLLCLIILSVSLSPLPSSLVLSLPLMGVIAVPHSIT